MTKDADFYPQWIEEPPRKGSYRSIFKWGAPDVFKHPNRRLYATLKEKLHLTDDDFREKQQLGNEPVRLDQPVRLSKEQIARFAEIVGSENVTTDEYSRVKFSHGKTMEEAVQLRHGIAEHVSDLVVHPRSKEDVQRIVTYCHEQTIPVYVYGGGSSVTFGLKTVNRGITLVMGTHMNRVLELNETNQTITVEPGLMGREYEALLNDAPKTFGAQRSYTGGHFPQSFKYSSIGGWIVTLSSGQQSSYYGDMYDIVLSQEYVTPAGSFRTLEYPAAATGPKLNDIMKGSEGAYGILVNATLKIFRYMPENRLRFAFLFRSWEDAVNAAREISQGEFGMPSLFRISDPDETDIALKLGGVDKTILDRFLRFRGYEPLRRCLYIGHTDGERSFCKNVKRNVRKIARAFHAMYLTGYPVRKWEEGRYTDPYMREDLNDFGIMIDTLESSVTWDNLHNLHNCVREYIERRPRTICMTHASHFYPQGTNLYFIFIGKMKDLAEYREFQAGIIDQILKHGGSLSHHHGIGKMIAPWIEEHLGTVQMDVLRSLKRHFDPHTIMNPGGTLGLDMTNSSKRST
ncbi:MAG: FAD-binding oxidoreductase [Deltaproteobacteria bacterium]